MQGWSLPILSSQLECHSLSPPAQQMASTLLFIAFIVPALFIIICSIFSFMDPFVCFLSPPFYEYAHQAQTSPFISPVLNI